MSTSLGILLFSFLLAGPAFCAETVIDQKDRKFSMIEVTVTPNLEFEIHRQAPGEKSSVVFAKEGVVEVRCSIHPRMKLTVTVKK